MFNEINKYYYITRDLKSGEILFHEGEECMFVGLVIFGSLKITSITYHGNEILLKSVRKGDMFGNNLIYSKTNTYRGSVQAVNDAIVALFTKENLEKALSTSPTFLRYYLTKSAEDGDRLNKSVKTLSIQDIEERFFYYLSINGDVIHIKSVTDLALKLNIRRETLSRLISSLEKEGLIQRIGKTIKKTK